MGRVGYREVESVSEPELQQAEQALADVDRQESA